MTRNSLRMSAKISFEQHGVSGDMNDADDAGNTEFNGATGTRTTLTSIKWWILDAADANLTLMDLISMPNDQEKKTVESGEIRVAIRAQEKISVRFVDGCHLLHEF